jgi:hypothetical protein
VVRTLTFRFHPLFFRPAVFLTSSSQPKPRERRHPAQAPVCLLATTHKGDEVMKSIRRFSLCKLALLAIAAMGASAIPLHAQATSGKFSLTHKVRWSSVVLPAGDYTFSVDAQNSPTRVVVRQGDGSTVGMFMPQSIAGDDLVGPSSLILRDENGESVVSTLRLKSVGVALHFASPKLSPAIAETAGLGPIAVSPSTR